METVELLRRTVMPVIGMVFVAAGSWMLFFCESGGSHRRRGKTSCLRLVGGPLIVLGGFLLIAFSDINL